LESGTKIKFHYCTWLSAGWYGACPTNSLSSRAPPPLHPERSRRVSEACPEHGRRAEVSNMRDLVLSLAFRKFTIIIRKARINTQVLLFGKKVLAYALYV